MFLSDDLATQVGRFTLVPQIIDAVNVPVIASGGIADGRGIVAAFALGAAAVQLGTAFLLCPESTILPPHRAALRMARHDSTVLTNVFSGRPARACQSRHTRAWPDQPDCSGVSARRRSAGALAFKGASPGVR
jgi:nitronate monooxygenase